MRARLLGSLVVMLALALPALAQDRRGGPSLDRVLPQIRQSVPGTFYDADGPFLTPDGRATYRIKWMTPDGRMIWFAVDARSGQVLGGMPSGPPPGRYGTEDRGTGWGNRGDGRNNWRQDNDRGNGWNGSGGNGRGGDDRGNGWGNSGGNGRGGDDRGNGWGNSGGNGRGGDGRGSEGHRGDDRGNGWGGRGGNDQGGGHDGSSGRGGDHGGNGRSGGDHRRRGGG